MKYRHVIIMVIILIIVFCVLLYISRNPLLTNEISSVCKIVVIQNQSNDKKESEIVERWEIIRIIEEIKKTKKIKTVRFPNHSVSMQHDSKLIIKIIYNDETTDTLHFSENKKNIYRFLNTKGSSGDYGYVIGENDGLYKLISNIETIND